MIRYDKRILQLITRMPIDFVKEVICKAVEATQMKQNVIIILKHFASFSIYIICKNTIHN